MIDGYQDAIGNPDADGNTTTDPDWDALNVVASEDGKDLTITLSYPCSYFDKLAAFVATSPVQQATVEANGDAWCTEPDTYVCNGPYMITEWTPLRAHRSVQEPELRRRLGFLQDRFRHHHPASARGFQRCLRRLQQR